MLIHSVTPLHLLTEQPDIPQRRLCEIEGGYVEGYDTPDGFQLSRLHSTDPTMYLKPDYAPGRPFHIPEGR